jgi:hypothetical protein
MQTSMAQSPLVGRSLWLARLAVLLCLGLMVADRWLILDQFGFRQVDDDQAIMWSGAEEMAQGHYHEPCFYGQRYSTMLEGWVAVPLLWMGVGHDRAVPLMTSVLTLFPFLLLAGALVRKRQWAMAAFVLAFPVTLPPEFGMVSSMPRGFVSGIFLASLAVLPLFSQCRIFFALSPFFAVLALFANPNAALVLAPAWLLILLENYAQRRLYLLGLLGAVPAAVLYYLGHRFYELRPHYQVHFPWPLSFKSESIRWSSISQYLDDVAPFLWGKGPVVLLLLGMLAVGFGIRRQWKPLAAVLAGTALLVISFGVNKVHDGIPSVFYPWSRMFLGVPFLIALLAAQWKGRLLWQAALAMPLLAGGFLAFKGATLSQSIERQLDPHQEKNLFVMEVAKLKEHCASIAEVAKAQHAELVVVGTHPTKHLTNYGCPCLQAEFPETLEPQLDRRTWHLQTYAPKVVPTVLFAGYWEETFAEQLKLHPGLVKVNQEPLLYVLKGNTLPTMVLLDSLNLSMRRVVGE